MTPEQVIDLLTLAASHDSRTVGKHDVKAWFDIATEQDWHAGAAMRAVQQHATRDPMPVRPAHVTAILSEVRDRIRRSLFRIDITPPRELADDPRAEVAWRQEYTRNAVDRALEEWAVSGVLPESLPARPELGVVPRPQLEAKIRQLADRKKPK